MRCLVIDCETSGLSSEKNKVLTVGMLHAQITREKLKILNRKHILVKHAQYNPNKIALRINKIDLVEHHKKGLTPRNACAQINDFLQENTLVKQPILGHNLRFDMRFLSALHKQGRSSNNLLGAHVDTMVLWRQLIGLRKIPWVSKSSLKTLSKYCNVDYTGAHDALNDCRITAEVYHRLLQV